jgi:hypothetical protein
MNGSEAHHQTAACVPSTTSDQQSDDYADWEIILDTFDKVTELIREYHTRKMTSGQIIANFNKYYEAMRQIHKRDYEFAENELANEACKSKITQSKTHEAIRHICKVRQELEVQKSMKK